MGEDAAITIAEYAANHGITELTARKRLNKQVDLGNLMRKKGMNNSYIYFKKIPVDICWHDPFNLVKRNEMARSVQKDEGEDTETVEESGHVSDPEEVAAYATPSHDLASV
jgi:predicted transcriptional regulator